jgi:hypothetical protein
VDRTEQSPHSVMYDDWEPHPPQSLVGQVRLTLRRAAPDAGVENLLNGK